MIHKAWKNDSVLFQKMIFLIFTQLDCGYPVMIQVLEQN